MEYYVENVENSSETNLFPSETNLKPTFSNLKTNLFNNAIVENVEKYFKKWLKNAVWLKKFLVWIIWEC